MTDEHRHDMYVTGYSPDGKTMYRKCHFCDHTDSVAMPSKEE